MRSFEAKTGFMAFLPGPGSHSMFPHCPSRGAGVPVSVPRVAPRQKPVLRITCQVPVLTAFVYRVAVEGAGVQRAVRIATRQNRFHGLPARLRLP